MQIKNQSLETVGNHLFFPQLFCVVPKEIDNFVLGKNNPVIKRRNYYTKLSLNDVLTIDNRSKDIFFHNYQYYYPPHIRSFKLDDYDIDLSIRLGGIFFRDPESDFLPWHTDGIHNPSAVKAYEEMAKTILLQMPQRLEQSAAIESQIYEILSVYFRSLIVIEEGKRVIDYSYLSVSDLVKMGIGIESYDFLQESYPYFEIPDSEIDRLNSLLSQVLELRKPPFPTDGLYAQETSEPHSLYEKYYLKKYSARYSNYTGFERFGIYGQWLANSDPVSSYPEADNYRLWAVNRGELSAEVTYLHYPSLGGTLLTVKPVQVEKDLPKDGREIIQKLKARIYSAYKLSLDFDAIVVPPPPPIADLEEDEEEQNTTPVEPSYLTQKKNLLSQLLELSGEDLDLSTITTENVNGIFGQIYSRLDNSVTYQLKHYYLLHCLYPSCEFWRFSNQRFLSSQELISGERIIEVLFPIDNPMPMAFSIKEYNGVQVSLILSGNTFVAIDLDNKEPIIFPDNSRGFRIKISEEVGLPRQIITLLPNSLKPTIKTAEDVELIFSERLDPYPVLRIEYHHEYHGVKKMLFTPDESDGQLELVEGDFDRPNEGTEENDDSSVNLIGFGDYTDNELARRMGYL